MTKRIAVLATGLLAFAIAARSGNEPVDIAYRVTAEKIIDAALADNGAWDKLSWLCDRIGNRISSSENYRKAVAWAAAEMKKDGLVNVVTPKVMVPQWIRGQERASIVAPIARNLPMLGLGGSVGTPPEGITAPLIIVSSFDELERLGRNKVEGKIVLFNVPYTGYGPTVRYRSDGPSRAARLGARATLVRSVTPVSLQTPHTGALRYTDDLLRIPAAAVTIEDALLLQRLVSAGETVTVKLEMQARLEADVEAANVIGEIAGRERPNEIVVIGGHLDSWDVGQGAQDDGSGVVAAMQAVALLQKLGLKPRRTIRVVLWADEEYGSTGSAAYRQWIGSDIKNHVAAIEMDGGAERPLGFGVAGEGPLQRAKPIGKLLDRIGAGSITIGGGGADIAPLMKDGVPGVAHRSVGTRYFEWHHTQADTIDKIKPEELRLNVAAMAVMVYVLADMPERLDGK